MKKAQFQIGQKVILGASFSRKYAIGCTVSNIEYSKKINRHIYTLQGEDGNKYAGLECDIIAA